MKKAKELSLIEKAKQHKTQKDKITDQDIELALAWVRDEISISQGCAAYGKYKQPAAFYCRLANSLKKYILNQKEGK